MQGLDVLELVILGGPGIIIGIIIGYFIGAQESYGTLERLTLSIVIGIIGGIITALVIAEVLGPSEYGPLLSVMGFTAGVIFGALLNWQVPVKAPVKRHVVFDPVEDDAEFDRQLREVLGTDE